MPAITRSINSRRSSPSGKKNISKTVKSGSKVSDLFVTFRLYSFWLPSQNRPACRAGFVDAADAGHVRSCFYNFGLFIAFLRDREHGLNEKVDLVPALGFGGFDHDCAWDYQRK